MDLKTCRKDCLLSVFSALLLLTGDLSLSLIPAAPGDSGLFAREAYLSGAWQSWRLPVLLATGLLGFFTVRASYAQIRPVFPGTRRVLLAGGVIYLASAGVLHFFIGSLADWPRTLAPLLGAKSSTWDFVLSQGSGNGALCIWMAANALWARRQEKKNIICK